MLDVKKSKRSNAFFPRKVLSARIPKERQGSAPTIASAIVESTAAFGRGMRFSSTRNATRISIIDTELVTAATTMQR